MKTVILGEAWQAKLDEALRALDLEPLYLPQNPNLDPRLRSHADLSFFRAGEEIWLSSHLFSTKLPEILKFFGYFVHFSIHSEQFRYPNDARMNLLTLGKRLFYSPKASDPDIVNFLTSKGGYQGIAVKQGYLRCSCLPVDENSLITADHGIASAARKAGLDVLQITPGHVALEGFPYGFLGGAAFLLDEKNLILTGHFDEHPDKGRIETFLNAKGVSLHFLTQEPVFDIGSAFVLEATSQTPADDSTFLRCHRDTQCGSYTPQTFTWIESLHLTEGSQIQS